MNNFLQEPFADRDLLEDHASKIHQINREGLQKLASLVEGCHWLNKASRCDQQPKTPSKETEENEDSKEEEEGCVISEKHVYKYRCAHCSLAFKTQDKLEIHSHYHLIRDATKCRLCERNFRSVQALLKHLEASHSQCPEEELTQYRLSLMTNPLMLAGMAGQALDDMLTDSEKMDNSGRKDPGGGNDAITKDQMENIVKQAKKVDKILNYPMEKYLDPNRPFKCDVCKESFTQKNILLVHFNSVSHLHRLKKVMREQQENNQPSSLLLTPQSDKVILSSHWSALLILSFYWSLRSLTSLTRAPTSSLSWAASTPRSSWSWRTASRRRRPSCTSATSAPCPTAR